MTQPNWLAEAWRHLSVRERRGAQHDNEILAFYRDAGHPEIRRDEVPWCAAFVGACLERCDVTSTRSLLARSYLKWGHEIAEPRFGAVTVLRRGADPAAGHVGFYLGETADDVMLLGGNQSDRVSVAAYGKDRLLGYRWPFTPDSDEAATERPGRRGGDGLFPLALAHVLAMEGGYSNDPHDPGGPTNKGITLAVYQKFLGPEAGDVGRETLIARLKAIPDESVREIYASRYWRPSRSAEMPSPIALMHFDASVNHGLRGGAELLQQAARVTVDGEIGPITMRAVTSADPAELLERYAEYRRARYRALPHFWRFGRGWLNRVSKTLARAQELSGASGSSAAHGSSSKQKGNSMILPGNPSKPWGQSLTIWGALLTALSTVVPVLGPAIGFDITPDLVRQAGEQMVGIIQAIGGLLGTIMTIYGRARAQTSLSTRFIG